MGAEQSTSTRSNKQQTTSNVQNEKERLLLQQKALYEQKYAELLRMAQAQEKNNRAAQAAIQEEARKMVEKIMKQKEEDLLRQNSQMNASPASTSQTPTSSFEGERHRTPYRLPGSAISSPTIRPSQPSANVSNIPPLMGSKEPYQHASNIYPNISAVSSGVTNISSQPTRHVSSFITSSTRDANSNATSSLQTRMTTATVGNTQMNNNNVASVKPTAPMSSRRDVSSDFEFVTIPQETPTPLLKTSTVQPSAPPAPRDRSISRTRNKDKANEDDELNCPTCNSPYIGNIYQCQRGHSSCRNCKLGNKPCGSRVSGTRVGRSAQLCYLPITDMRNITLEAYICERKTYCPNSDEGCNLVIKLADMEAHVKECPFGEIVCPLSAIFHQCYWKGKMSQIAEHFDAVHQMHRQGNVDTEMVLLNLVHDNLIVYLVVIGCYNFLFQAKVSESDGKMYIAVQLLGTHHSAAKWTYEIHIYNKRQPRRKYQYTDICRSVNTPLDNITRNSECVAIPLAYAKTFVNDGCLTYKFFIKKGVEPSYHFGNNQRGRGGGRGRGGARRRVNS